MSSAGSFGIRRREARHDAQHTLDNISARTCMWTQFKFGGLSVRRRLPKHDDHYYRMLDIDVASVSTERGGFKQGVKVRFTAIQPAYTKGGKNYYPEEKFSFLIEGGLLFWVDTKGALVTMDLSEPRFARDADDGMVISALLAEVLFFLWEGERLIFSDKAIDKRRKSERTKREKAAKAAEAAKAAAAAAAKAAEAAKAAKAKTKKSTTKKSTTKAKSTTKKSTTKAKSTTKGVKKKNGTNGNGKTLVEKNLDELKARGLVK